MESSNTRYFVIDNTPEVGRVNSFLCHVSEGRGYIHFFNVDINPCPIKLPDFKKYNTSLFIVKLFIKSKEFLLHSGYTRNYSVDEKGELQPSKPFFYSSSHYLYYADISTLEVIPIEIDKRLPSNLINTVLEKTDYYVDGGANAITKLHKVIYKCLELKLDISDFSIEVNKEQFEENLEKNERFYTEICLIEKNIKNININDYKKVYDRIIKVITTISLDSQEYAFKLYNLFCQILKIKYGLVDRDFDDNPTKRGKEWIDIHHIKEYELDDIAKRTSWAQKLDELDRKDPDNIGFFELEYTLEDLKPYNKKEELVYANKIEHFLLHYCIQIYKGKNHLCGGPNYLWDDVVSLDLYGFDTEFQENIQNNKDFYYSILSSEDITKLYRNIIIWGKIDIKKIISSYWNNYQSVLKKISKGYLYIKDIEKFITLFEIIGLKFKASFINSLKDLIFKFKREAGRILSYEGHIFDDDLKTVRMFIGLRNAKSFTIPYNVKNVDGNALVFAENLEKIIIPKSVETLHEAVFRIPILIQKGNGAQVLKKIVYVGSQEEWDKKFSNVDMCGIKLVCMNQ